jgi:hypothetical protein
MCLGMSWRVVSHLSLVGLTYYLTTEDTSGAEAQYTIMCETLTKTVFHSDAERVSVLGVGKGSFV